MGGGQAEEEPRLPFRPPSPTGIRGRVGGCCRRMANAQGRGLGAAQANRNRRQTRSPPPQPQCPPPPPLRTRATCVSPWARRPFHAGTPKTRSSSAAYRSPTCAPRRPTRPPPTGRRPDIPSPAPRAFAHRRPRMTVPSSEPPRLDLVRQTRPS